MASIRKLEDIQAWQLARQLTRAVYKLSNNSPQFSRDFGLRDQIRRASGSIMQNIAEGFDAESNAEFIRFLRYAKRSCTEVQSELYVAIDQQYISEERFHEVYRLAARTRSVIAGFIRYLQKDQR